MWIIGLTGAVGAGKSRVATNFRQIGIPVHCADTYIHFLFEKDYDVQQEVKSLWPDVFVDGKIDRALLGNRVLSSPQDLSCLEALLYPRLARDQRKFIQENQYIKKKFVILDVPLLFEVGLDNYCDCVILACAPLFLRKHRVMRRKGMTVKKFHIFERLHMRDSIRIKKANFIIYTGLHKGNALKIIRQILLVLSQQPIPKWQGKWPKNLRRKPDESRNSFRHGNNRF